MQQPCNNSNWPSLTTLKNQKYSARSEFIPFVSIDAQRDIHHELNEKSSFVGRVLSQVKYNKADVDELEKVIAEINNKAVSKSTPLAKLKKHSNALNESFDGAGSAEVTPFPKKLRDLSKNFSVHFGDSAASSFSMEYHGMGTRSWASMLAVSLGIPVAVVSDNDTAGRISSKTIVEKQISKIKNERKLDLSADWFFLDYLHDPNDFEAEIVKNCGLKDEVIDAFVEIAKGINSNSKHTTKRAELETMSEDALIAEMRGAKTNYSGFLADVLAKNEREKSREIIVPLAFQAAFSKVEGWLT